MAGWRGFAIVRKANNNTVKSLFIQLRRTITSSFPTKEPPMHDRDGWIWYDGEMVPWRSATTHVLTHSLHYGLSVIEGVRAYRTEAGHSAVFRLREHTRRFLDSAKAYRMPVPFSQAELELAQLQVLRENRLEQAYLRPIAFYGSEKLGVSPKGAQVHVAVAAWPWGGYLGDDAGQKGIRVKTSSFARNGVNSLLPRAKIAASYTNSLLASLEASEDGYDEALLLDADGFVAEGPGENLFIVKNGCLFEPELSSALVGITRDTVKTLARARGYEVSERRLTRDDVYLADEAFFSGTAAEVVPIVELDRRPIVRRAESPQSLRSVRRRAWRKAAHHWLTPLEALDARAPTGRRLELRTWASLNLCRSWRRQLQRVALETLETIFANRFRLPRFGAMSHVDRHLLTSAAARCFRGSYLGRPERAGRALALVHHRSQHQREHRQLRRCVDRNGRIDVSGLSSLLGHDAEGGAPGAGSRRVGLRLRGRLEGRPGWLPRLVAKGREIASFSRRVTKRAKIARQDAAHSRVRAHARRSRPT
jgi:branched-chain amino acid aminotransferase